MRYRKERTSCGEFARIMVSIIELRRRLTRDSAVTLPSPSDQRCDIDVFASELFLRPLLSKTAVHIRVTKHLSSVLAEMSSNRDISCIMNKQGSCPQGSTTRTFYILRKERNSEDVTHKVLHDSHRVLLAAWNQ